MCVRAFRVLLFRISRTWFLRGAAVLVLICCIGIAAAQVELPEVVVRAAKPKPQPKPTATTRPGPAAHARAAYALKSMDAVRAKLRQAILYIERSPKLVRSITSFPYIVNSL